MNLTRKIEFYQEFSQKNTQVRKKRSFSLACLIFSETPIFKTFFLLHWWGGSKKNTLLWLYDNPPPFGCWFSNATVSKYNENNIIKIYLKLDIKIQDVQKVKRKWQKTVNLLCVHQYFWKVTQFPSERYQLKLRSNVRQSTFGPFSWLKIAKNAKLNGWYFLREWFI